MTKQLLASAAGVFAAAAMMSAQEPAQEVRKKELALEVELQARAAVRARTDAEQLYQLNGRPGAIAASVVKGKPFSATEEQHFLQVLGDGTRVETRQTTRIYRDSEGRMRLEDVTAGNQAQAGFEFGQITIVDPVANTNTALNPQQRTKLTTPGGLNGAIRFLVRDTINSFTKGIATSAANPGGFVGTVTLLAAGPGGAGQPKTLPEENLGMKNVNGVMARGERTTSVIPAGEIGNNREIRIVTERWFSDDLQLLIKSTNTDPRFGETTYQLTGLSQGEQSPSLFQVPADYTEVQGGRGARGGAKAKEKDGGQGGRGARGGGPAPAAAPAPGAIPPPPPPGGRGTTK